MRIVMPWIDFTIFKLAAASCLKPQRPAWISRSSAAHRVQTMTQQTINIALVVGAMLFILWTASHRPWDKKG
jgi:hypothetical protein